MSAPRAMVNVRFESREPCQPGQKGEALWSPALVCRLESIDLQPGPRWRVSLEVSTLWKVPVYGRKDLPADTGENGILPAGMFAQPGQRIRIEYENLGDKPATFRGTLWYELSRSEPDRTVAPCCGLGWGHAGACAHFDD